MYSWECIKGELMIVDKEVETSRDCTTLSYVGVSKHLFEWRN